LRPWCARCPWLRAHSVDVPLQAHTTLADRVTGRGDVDWQAQRVPPGHLDDVDAAARGELHVGPRAGVHFEDAELAVTRIALELRTEDAAIAHPGQQRGEVAHRRFDLGQRDALAVRTVTEIGRVDAKAPAREQPGELPVRVAEAIDEIVVGGRA